MGSDSENIKYLKRLIKNIPNPTSKILQKIYMKAKNNTSYKVTHRQLTRAQVRATRKESIQAAQILRRKLGLAKVNRPKSVIDLTHNVINLR